MVENARLGMESRCHCTVLRKASRRISQLHDAALAASGVKARLRAILAQVRRSEPAIVGALPCGTSLVAEVKPHILS